MTFKNISPHRKDTIIQTIVIVITIVTLALGAGSRLGSVETKVDIERQDRIQNETQILDAIKTIQRDEMKHAEMLARISALIGDIQKSDPKK